MKRKKALRIKIVYNNKVFCCQHAKQTMAEFLKEIHKTYIGGLEVFSNDVNNRTNLFPYNNHFLIRGVSKSYMWEPVCDGWFYNCQGNTKDKEMQLLLLKQSLLPGLEYEVGENLKIETRPEVRKTIRPKTSLKVTFEDGSVIEEEKHHHVLALCVERIGAVWIFSKNIKLSNNRLFITQVQGAPEEGRIEIEPGYWIKYPNSASESERILGYINIELGRAKKNLMKIERVSIFNNKINNL